MYRVNLQKLSDITGNKLTVWNLHHWKSLDRQDTSGDVDAWSRNLMDYSADN